MTRLAPYPALVLALGVVLSPLILLVRISLYESGQGIGFYRAGTFTVDHYAALVHAPVAFTLLFALAIATITLLLALGLALVLDSLSPKSRMVALTLLFAPKLAGALTTAFGLQWLLPRGTLTALLAEILFVLPYAVLSIVLALREIPVELAPAARGLGANRWQVFRSITLPLAWPGVWLAFQLSLVWGLGAFVGPLFLSDPRDATLAIQIHNHGLMESRWPVAAAEGVLLFALTAVAFRVNIGGKRQ